MSQDDREAWGELCRALEDLGLSAASIRQHQPFILAWFNEQLEAGLFGEELPEQPEGGPAPLDRLEPITSPQSAPNRFESTTGSLPGPSSYSPMADPVQLGSPLQAQPVAKSRTPFPAHIHPSPSQARGTSTKTLPLSNVVNMIWRAGIDRRLREASKDGNAIKAKKSLDRGADVNNTDGRGQRPLFHAAKNGDLETVSLLLHKGADVDAKDSFEITALSEAVSSQRAQVTRCLLENGASIDARDRFQQTALHVAVMGQSDEMT